MIPIGSYGKVYNRHNGRRYTHDILDGPWWAQEKIDGSQISFGLVDGELVIRSKRVQVHTGGDAGMFQPAVEALMKRKNKMVPGFVYSGEAVTSCRHNVLSYDRCPRGFVILFDALHTRSGYSVLPDSLGSVASDLDLEAVPILSNPSWTEMRSPGALIEGPSVLGGQREGIVIKRYDRPDPTDHDQPLKFKLTTAEFQEKMTGRKDPEAKPRDLVSETAQAFALEARYRKAVQALRDDGRARGGMVDIGPCLKVLAQDMDDDAAEEAGRMLWRGFRARIIREANSGFVQWYKDRLAAGDYQ